ncbi:hypothetical protein PAECIP111891_02233 [Paenibacillus allorhizoplanae]|uniref:Flagellar hook-length control protein FliK n=1 Tax=Paenibacillus allorhizoplanae TaxID=2905648 RepID=A0ABM9C5F2_9BACL|nr:hypothetical protein [Paenibacillus allorhizoplanae]CAH1203110.1 hypothetical protein PAECIP111891_02233 [Paenibacillus allorhizoplanae]
MNISGLIRNLIGDLTAADPKTLELKVGQIVKGVVLQLLSDQEALVNIGGTQVRAKLETPLKQGDVTMLQVQPESKGGQIILKPLVASDVQIADDSLGELLKAFEIKDTASNRQMVQQIQQEGIPVSKENVKAFESVLREMPQGVGKEEWLQAAVLASKRGLPLTPATVDAIRQVTTGPPAGQVLEKLEQQANALLEQDPTHPAAETAKQVVSLLKELRATAAAVRPAEPAAPASAAEVPAAVPPQAGSAPPAATQAGGTTAAAPRGSEPTAAAGAAPPAASAAGEEAPPAPQAAGAATLAASAKPAADVHVAQARSAEPVRQGEPLQAGSPAPVQAPPAKQEGGLAPREAQVSAPQETPKADQETNWISKMLKAVGVEHESHVAAKLDERGNPVPVRQQATDDSFSLISTHSSNDQQGDSAKPATETLKSLLLQLTASDDTPAPLKEAAQQAVSQITGQQLMLTNDKNAMFTQMTMFVPFLDNTGQQTAAIHIQSRKGSRGEVDASNCRLLFDLQMKVMGNTLLDVQVVNKIVSLTIHNDHPALAGLMESSKDEIATAMNRVGYQFISLKCSPYPKPPDIQEGKEEGTKIGSLDGRVDLSELYRPRTYKGVDVRA